MGRRFMVDRMHTASVSPVEDTRSQKSRLKTGPSRLASRQEARQNIQVAVRLRPLSSREVGRGDVQVWGVDNEEHVCILKQGISVPKYQFDTVYREAASNYDVFKRTASPIVESVVEGINGTVFAYGVTSSGKTHTMLGHSKQPGLVPQALQHLFHLIENRPDRFFLLKVSMIEIYNEVLNDLLEPGSTNLKLREDAARANVFVESLKNVEILSADHALSLVAAGDAQRKVSSTQFNEDSSRSHTLCRVSIESCDTVTRSDRMFSMLNLIDLAGSESGRASSNTQRRREGAYINKSLLTLGAVISKLSEGSAVHIPFRDSKLTRLLQSSLSGSGARVAVVCCITPAAAQAEETHNTLKFAMRAKAIKIMAVRNKIAEDKSQIEEYQRLIRQLREQLEHVMLSQQEAAKKDQEDSHLEEKILDLREKLEQEQQEALSRAAEKAALETRIGRLTRIVLNSTRALLASSPVNRSEGASGSITPRPLLSREWPVGSSRRTSTPDLRRASSRDGALLSAASAGDAAGGGGAQGSGFTLGSASGYGEVGARSKRSTPVDLVRGAGDIHPGAALSLYDFQSPYVAENEVLREHLRMIMDEFEASHGADSARRLRISGSNISHSLSHSSSLLPAPGTTLRPTEAVHARAHGANPSVGPSQLKERLTPFEPGVAVSSDSSGGTNDVTSSVHTNASQQTQNGDDQLKVLETNVRLLKDDASAAVAVTSHATAVASSGTAIPPATVERLQQIESRMELALERLEAKEKELQQERRTLARCRYLEQKIEQQRRSVTKDNQQLRAQVSVLEKQSSLLQGYNLDSLTAEELADLIAALTAAVERIRITTELRHLQHMSEMQPSSSRGGDSRLSSSPLGDEERLSSHSRPSVQSTVTVRAPLTSSAGRRAMIDTGASGDGRNGELAAEDSHDALNGDLASHPTGIPTEGEFRGRLERKTSYDMDRRLTIDDPMFDSTFM